MKKLMVFLAVMSICVLFLAHSISAAEKIVDLKREVIRLCAINADLADELNNRLDKATAELNYGVGSYVAYFFINEQGQMIERIPTSLLFLMVADLIRRDQKIDSEVVGELLKYHQMFLKALEYGNRRPFVAERIK